MYLPHTASLDAPASLGRPYTHSTPVKGWSSLIGIVTAIVGNILISFALNTQRYAHMRLGRDRQEREGQRRSQKQKLLRPSAPPRTYGTQQSQMENGGSEPDPSGGYSLPGEGASTEVDALIPEKAAEESTEKSYLNSPIWWLGIGLMVVGEAGNFLAYGFAPASIVSPLGVVALVSNCLIAPLLLHEPFRWRDGVGVVIAVAGCVTVVLSASDSNPKLDPDSIWHLITRWEFETYLAVTVALIVVLVFASNRFGDRTILIDLGLVGLFGGYTALSTKGVASLLSNAVWRVVTFPITYLLLAVLIFTAVMQIKYVNRALQRFNATMVIPTQFVLFTISVIVGSAVLYRDFERETAEDAAKFVAGCALTFLGVWCITSGRGDDSASDEEEGEEDDAVELVDDEGVQPEIREREPSERRQSLLAGSSKDTSSLKPSRTSESIPPSVMVTPDLWSSQSQQSSSLTLDESSTLTKKAWDASLDPSNLSAIHVKSTSNLPETAGDPQKPPPMHATTSAPVVPRVDPSSPYRPKTPLHRGLSGPPSPQVLRDSPTTPQRRLQQDNQHQDPTGSTRLLNRHSIVGLLPGPLTSPLSSSLSAIVADSLRRGLDTPPSLRRRSYKGRGRAPSGLDSRQASSATPLKRHSIASGEMDFNEVAGLRAGVGSPSHRGRSFSATIGEMFKSGKTRRLSGAEDIGEQQQR